MHISRRGLQVTLALLAAGAIITGWTGHAMAGHRTMSDVFVLPAPLDPNAEDGSGEPDVGQNSRFQYPHGPIGAEATINGGSDWLRWISLIYLTRSSWLGR